MALVETSIEYSVGEVRFEAFMAYDDAARGPLPGVLIAPTWAGRDRFACDKARRLASLGYVGFAIDLYGQAQTGEGAEACTALMTPLVNDRMLLKQRICSALDSLKHQASVDSSRIAAIGFCFGGLCVLDLARSGADLRGVVSFHGLFSAPSPALETLIKPKILVLHGFEDPMATPQEALALGEELTARNADWQIHFYGRTQHAFTNPKANDPSFGTVYDPSADERSWRSLMDFLEEVLK